MKTIKMLLISMSVFSLVSLGLDGCEKKSDKPAVEKSVKSKASGEQPTKSKESKEHPSKEHPSKEDPSKEDPPGNE